MNRSKAAILLILILFPVAWRLIDHRWNFTPVGALSLFVGAYFFRKSWAMCVPIVVMFLSDVALGIQREGDWKYAFHDLVPVIYGCFVFYACLGFGLRSLWSKSRAADADGQPAGISPGMKMASVPAGAFLGAVVFFVVTNFADWALFYPHTFDGLMTCYVAGLPFFRAMLMGDFIFGAILFGGYELLRHRVPAIEKSQLLYAD